MKSNSLLCQTLREYTQCSGLHGLRYLGEGRRPWSERLWWTLATLTSLLVVIGLVRHSCLQWMQSPVLVTFAEQPTPIWDIPFPTITVCPPNKYRKQVFDMGTTWRTGRKNMTEEKRRLSDDLMLVCRSLNDVNMTEDYPLLSDEETLKNIIDVSPTLYKSVECASVLGNTRCDWMLDTMVTREGVCFTYNALPNGSIFRQKERPQIWSLEEGYSDQEVVGELPVRAKGAGFLQGVLLALKTNLSELDFHCRPLEGFKIAFTSPADFPRTYNRYHFVPATGITQISIAPRVTDTDDALRGYSPHQRHCYFPSERRLAYFTTYTQDNCDVECLTNYTFRMCRCVDFYMPRNASTPLCGYGNTNCMNRAERTLAKELMVAKVNRTRLRHFCDCLPACMSVDYVAEISQGQINYDRIQERLRIDGNESYKNITMNFVYFFLKDSEFRPLLRRELYGVTAFIANCGGLMGLCCGFSVLSLVEIVYFFTLRLWNNASPSVKVSRSKVATPQLPPRKAWIHSYVY